MQSLGVLSLGHPIAPWSGSVPREPHDPRQVPNLSRQCAEHASRSAGRLHVRRLCPVTCLGKIHAAVSWFFWKTRGSGSVTFVAESGGSWWHWSKGLRVPEGDALRFAPELPV